MSSRSPLFSRLIVGDVMQHAGIGAARDDRRVGRRLCAVPAELVQQLGFDFVFAHAGLVRIASRADAPQQEICAARRMVVELRADP